MTDEEREAAEAVESEKPLGDEAPPEIPDISGPPADAEPASVAAAAAASATPPDAPPPPAVGKAPSVPPGSRSPSARPKARPPPKPRTRSSQSMAAVSAPPSSLTPPSEPGASSSPSSRSSESLPAASAPVPAAPSSGSVSRPPPGRSSISSSAISAAGETSGRPPPPSAEASSGKETTETAGEEPGTSAEASAVAPPQKPTAANLRDLAATQQVASPVATDGDDAIDVEVVIQETPEVDVLPEVPKEAPEPLEPPPVLTIPDDAVPTSQEAAVSSVKPASVLMAMRIISVGEDNEVPPVVVHEVDVDVPIDTDEGSVDTDDLPIEEGEDPVDTQEIPVDEVEEPVAEPAPDSTEEIEGSEVEGVEAKAPPPPPRRRKPPPPPPRTVDDKEKAVVEAKKKRKVRPWWEELFDDDFNRALTQPTRPQIVKEVDFIQNSLGVKPGGVVFDLACGSGEHAVELASRGYGVVGYDLSVTQLAAAQDVARERGQKLNFLQGDMREMAFDEMFDGAYCWSSSFGYFEEDKNLNIIERVYRALRPGGTFLLDVANRDFVVAQEPNSVWFEGDGCTCMDEMRVDFITSRLKVKRTVMLDDGRSRECNYSLRLYGLHELGRLLHSVGFRIREASGEPSIPGVFFGASAPRILMLAQRPE